jgi:selenocysteine lyase/cysteine desulfurase
VEIREVDIRLPAHAESALLEAVDARTRLLAVSAVQWNDGFRLDLHSLGASCKARGVLFFVDAIQQLGALRIDVQACHISFLAADAHKWLLGPEGIAVFYSCADARPLLRLRQLGWHMFDQPFSFGRTEWTPADSARRFGPAVQTLWGRQLCRHRWGSCLPLAWKKLNAAYWPIRQRCLMDWPRYPEYTWSAVSISRAVRES